MSRRSAYVTTVHFIGNSASIINFERINRRFIVNRRKMKMDEETGVCSRYYVMDYCATLKNNCCKAQDIVVD